MRPLRPLYIYPLLLMAGLGGCATPTGGKPSAPTSSTPTSTAGVPASVTGNWQGSLTAAAGTSSLTTIAGTINQYGPSDSVTQFTSAVIHVTGSCFDASPILPLQGTNNGNGGKLILDSYTVNDENLHLSAVPDSTGSTMQGGYTVSGGCAAGSSGTFTATRYMPVTGTFTGTVASASAVSPGPSASIVLTQGTDTTGSGTYLLTGTVTLAGTGCSLNATATAEANNYIQGSMLHLVLTPIASSTTAVTLTATTDATGKRLTPLQLSVTGGSCAGVYTSGTLLRP